MLTRGEVQQESARARAITQQIARANAALRAMHEERAGVWATLRDGGLSHALIAAASSTPVAPVAKNTVTRVLRNQSAP